jgi:hypothetical protein
MDGSWTQPYPGGTQFSSTDSGTTWSLAGSSVEFQVTAIPEPSSFALLCMATLAIGTLLPHQIRR